MADDLSPSDIARALGRLSAAKLTPAERSAKASKAGKASAAKLTAAEKSARGRAGAAKREANRIKRG